MRVVTPLFVGAVLAVLTSTGAIEATELHCTGAAHLRSSSDRAQCAGRRIEPVAEFRVICCPRGVADWTELSQHAN